MTLTADHKRLLRREGLLGAGPDDVGSAQRKARDAGNHALADQLGEARVAMEEASGADAPSQPATPAGASEPAAGTTSAAGRSTSKRRRGKTPRRRSRLGRAVRQAVIGKPEQQIAGGIELVGEVIWTWFGFITLATLLALIVRHPARFTAAVDDASHLFQAVISPKALLTNNQGAKS